MNIKKKKKKSPSGQGPLPKVDSLFFFFFSFSNKSCAKAHVIPSRISQLKYQNYPISLD